MTENQITTTQIVSELLEKIESGALSKAEAEFNKFPEETQLAVVKESKFNPEIMLLAKDATPLMGKLDSADADAIIDATGYGESCLLECLSPEQFQYSLFELVFLTKANLPEEDEIPREFHPNLGIGLLLGLKSSQDNDHLAEVFKALGAETIHLFIGCQVKFVGSILDAQNPTLANLHVKHSPYVACDVSDFLEKLYDACPKVFLEFSHLVIEGRKPSSNIKSVYFHAAEVCNWDDIKPPAEDKTSKMFEEVDMEDPFDDEDDE